MESRLKTSALVLVGTAGTVLLSGLVVKYGVEGTLRLLWEGDPLPPHIRQALDALSELERSNIPAVVRKVDRIDVTIQTALLNSVDGGESDDSRNQDKKSNALPWLFPEDLARLKKEVSLASHLLDKTAADVDAVPSYGHEEVKQERKRLSTLIVASMERVDHFMTLCLAD